MKSGTHLHPWRTLAVLASSPPFSQRAGQAFIAVGLAGACGYLLNPSLPIATAVALIALGATIITVRQFPRCSLLYVHFAVYATLYLLIVGAMGDLVSRSSATGFSLAQSADLSASAAIMLFVAKMCVTSQQPQESSR
jgi:hypothetical protein